MPRKKITVATRPAEPPAPQPPVPEPATQKQEAAPAPAAYVAFGVPRAGRMPVGARFAPHEAEAARWVARHLGLELLEAWPDTPAAALAERLRGFELRANGSPVLPPLAQALWEDLRALADTRSPAAATRDGEGSGIPDAAPVHALPDAAVAPGDIVLAPEYDRRGCVEGWWEAAVLAVPGEAGAACTVCWLDEPESGFRRRRRDELVPFRPARPQDPAAD